MADTPVGLMVRHDDTTVRQVRIPTVLVVGGSASLVAVVAEAAIAAQVLVTPCSVAEVTTVAAEVRPLVIVVAEEVLNFDPGSFRELARDTGARLLAVSLDELHAGRVAGQLDALIAEAEEAGSDGRAAFHPG